MWDLWLVDRNAAAKQHPQEQVSQLMANRKVIQKQSSFGKKNTINVWHYSSGQQADFCSVHHHHTVQSITYSGDHMLQGSAQVTSGDTGLGIKTKPSSSRHGTNELTSLRETGWSEFLPRESGHLKRGVNWLCWPEEKKKNTAQWLVYGARGTSLLGAYSTDHCGSAKIALNFAYSAWDTLVSKFQDSRKLDPLRSDNFCFSILCAAPPLPIRVNVS